MVLHKNQDSVQDITSLFKFYPNPAVVKGKAVPLQAWTGPEGSMKLRFPDFVTTAQDGGKLSALSALRTGRLYRRKCSW